ncbi:hypothetical protein LY78DRAFT_131484 [Colletotrichum sublineola]|nr:hypothetical protein LY78DRAFT_131484 [Colletotrichum sublineola]
MPPASCFTQCLFSPRGQTAGGESSRLISFTRSFRTGIFSVWLEELSSRTQHRFTARRLRGFVLGAPMCPSTGTEWYWHLPVQHCA